jgi:hypothetical protein
MTETEWLSFTTPEFRKTPGGELRQLAPLRMAAPVTV